jgi:hypothetical protein
LVLPQLAAEAAGTRTRLTKQTARSRTRIIC